MMHRTEEKRKRVQIILNNPQKEFLEKTAKEEGVSLSALIRKIVEQYRKAQMEDRLREAARALYSEYESNKELTTFTALDGEEFV